MYVPTKQATGTLSLPNGENLEYDNTKMFSILFGGDQLTVARARGAAALRCNHETVCERLEGLEPVIEDWHARLTLVKVSICNSMFAYLYTLCCHLLGYMEPTLQHQIFQREGHNVPIKKFNQSNVCAIRPSQQYESS